MKFKFYTSLLTCLLFLKTLEVQAWVYPEHRQIGLLAIENLSPENRAKLELLWSVARIGYEYRLTESVIDPGQGVKPSKLDYAAWFAISGDHSCSSENMLYNVLKTNWILNVADVTAQLKENIANSKNNIQHTNAIRTSDMDLQKADQAYANRAGSNNVHFLLARPDAATTPREYAIACLTKGAPLNAVAAYSWFHISALNKASRYAMGTGLTEKEKSELMLSAMADEAFGLHFLEDVFAAGHIAGTWGDASVRKGTHDYYNEKGLEVVAWNGDRYVVLGDAYMRQKDAERAALAVRLSLEQFIKAATGLMMVNDENDLVSRGNGPDSFSVCLNNYLPLRKVDAKYLGEVLTYTPVPGLENGVGSLPRFRSELGKFLGIVSSLDGTTVFSGFGQNQTQNGFMGGLEADIRFGIGLEGVMNSSGDGLIFLQFGYRQDASSSSSYSNNDHFIPPNTSSGISSAIPSRGALTLRLRMPFWLIPGDMLILGPILYLTNPAKLSKLAIDAGNGGLIPWQAGLPTSFGRFQFMLGREIGVYFYKSSTILLQGTNGATNLLEYKSTQFDFPFLEWRLMRTFSLYQSSSLMCQFNAGFDIPNSASVLIPDGNPVPPMKTVWHIGARIEFDWRKYF
jgi:hypothetical protein